MIEQEPAQEPRAESLRSRLFPVALWALAILCMWFPAIDRFRWVLIVIAVVTTAYSLSLEARAWYLRRQQSRSAP